MVNSVQDIQLRPLESGDSTRIAALLNDPDVLQNLRDHIPQPYRVSDAEEFIKFSRLKNPPYNFAILLHQQLVGIIGLNDVFPANKETLEIGYWLGQSYWNQGIASNAMEIMLDYVFTTFQLSKVVASVSAFNQASCRVLEKSGFSFVQLEKECHLKKGKLIDVMHYIMEKEQYLCNKKISVKS